MVEVTGSPLVQILARVVGQTFAIDQSSPVCQLGHSTGLVDFRARNSQPAAFLFCVANFGPYRGNLALFFHLIVWLKSRKVKFCPRLLKPVNTFPVSLFVWPQVTATIKKLEFVFGGVVKGAGEQAFSVSRRTAFYSIYWGIVVFAISGHRTNMSV